MKGAPQDAKRQGARRDLLVLLAVLFISSLAAQDSSIPATIGFNRDIRPILSDRCFVCHGPDASNRKASKLRLDVESDAKIKTRSGRESIAPGDSAASEVYRRVTSDNSAERMPPAYMGHEKLKPREIELIRRWIDQGAKWEQHWAYIAPQRPALPTVQDQAWGKRPIDRFVLARLERERLRPSPEADKARLIRRVTLDITGLPPTPDEVDTFLKDTSPNAYEKIVDRLLASPRYAERMTIRWLEAARYADTNGYSTDNIRDMWRWRDWVIDAFRANMPFDVFTTEQIAGDLLPDARPAQIIASGFHRNHRTSGEGGSIPEELRTEYVADRVETTSMVWLGMTMGCARCHDHKYDPITQRDFYRMFAYFNNVPEKGLVSNHGNEDPVVKAPLPAQQEQLDQLHSKIAAAQRHWDSLQSKVLKTQREWEKSVRDRKEPIDWTISDGLAWFAPLDGTDSEKVAGCPTPDGPGCQVPVVAGHVGQARSFDGKAYMETGSDPKLEYHDPFTIAAWIKPSSLNGAILSRMEDYFEGKGHAFFLKDGKLRLHVTQRFTDIGLRVETEAVLQPDHWQHVLVTYDGMMKASGVAIYVDGKPQATNILFDALTDPLTLKEPWRIGAGCGEKYRFRGLIDDVRVWTRAFSREEAEVASLGTSVEPLATTAPQKRTKAQENKLRFCFLDRYASQEIRDALAGLRSAHKERRQYLATIPTVMVMREVPGLRMAHILKRGAYDNPGEGVDAGIPGFLPPLSPEWPTNRLGLARWLTSKANPLTARVTVNRFWQMFFGVGLVKTVEDFGSRGELPLHPELLDWLAVEFMESGWDVKHILRTMLMSATYRQSSKVTPELLEADPENRLLSRGPRFRLPAEMIRDQALFSAGLLVEKLGGPSVKPYQPPGLWQELGSNDENNQYNRDKGEGLYRRSLYTYWRRTVAPPSMIIFDAPTRETCTLRTTRTNTPLQALILMNDEAVVEASRKLAERMMAADGSHPEARLAYGWRLVLARSPGVLELRVLLKALHRFETHFAKDREAASEFLKHGDSSTNPQYKPQELAAYSAVANLIFNLDAAVSKE